MQNMSDNKNPMQDALADVRHAYRLVYLYQERIYDIIKHIRKNMKLDYYYRDGIHYLGNLSTDITKKLAWDGIPLYNFSILLLPQSQNKSGLSKGDWMLVLHFLADRDVFDESGSKFKDGKHRPEEFVSAKESKSVLQIYLYYAESVLERKDMDNISSVWYGNDWPERGKKHEFKKDGYNGIVAYGKEFDLVDLKDEESLNKALKEFKEFTIEGLSLRQDFFTSE